MPQGTYSSGLGLTAPLRSGARGLQSRSPRGRPTRHQTLSVSFREGEEAWRAEEQGQDGWYRPRRLENQHDEVGGVALRAVIYFLRPKGFFP